MGRAEIKTTNFFSALQNTTSCKKQPQEHKAAVMWTLKPITSWADCEDEDDDEFCMHVVPLSPPGPRSLIPETIREEENDEELYAEGVGEDDEEETPEAEAKEKETNPIFPVQKPLPKAPSQPPVLSKKEQRRRELEEIDSVLAELGWSQLQVPATKPLGKEEEEHRRRPSQSLSNKPHTSTSTRALTCKPHKKEQKPLPQEGHADEVEGAIDHEALRNKVAASVNLQRGNVKRGNGCTASLASNLPCRAAVAEASARTAKVAAAKKKARSKQWNR